MITRKLRRCFPLALALGVLTLAATPASAVQYSFSNFYLPGSPTDVSSGIFLDVNDAGGGLVNFTITNSATNLPSVVAEIYFDDGTLLNIAQIIPGGPGVAFTTDHIAPPDLPQWDQINFHSGISGNPGGYFAVDAGIDAPQWGLSPGESVTIQYSLLGTNTFQDTINAIELALQHPGIDVDGGLRVGIHVTGINNQSGQSDSYVNGPAVPEVTPLGVPEPSALAIAGLGGLGLIGYGLRRRRTK